MVGNGLPACTSPRLQRAGAVPDQLLPGQPVRGRQRRPAADRRGLVQVRLAAAAVPAALHAGRQPDRQLHLRQGPHRSLSSSAPTACRTTSRCATRGSNWGPTVYDLRHMFQTYWTYELPFGKDRHCRHRQRAARPGRSAAGRCPASCACRPAGPFLLTSGRQTFNQQDAGVVLNGITVKELQNMVNVRPGPNGNVYFRPNRSIGADGRANPEFIAPPTTPGELGRVHLSLWSGTLERGPRTGEEVPARRPARASTSRRCSSTRSTIATRSSGATGGATLSIDSTTFGQSTTSRSAPGRYSSGWGFTSRLWAQTEERGF